MTTNEDGSLTWAVETNRRYEVVEMHLFDENARREEALCGTNSSPVDRRSMSGYLEDRLHGNRVGSVCESCEAFAPPFALRLSRDLEAEDMLDEAEEYRRLAETLQKETGQDRSGG